MPGDHIHIDIGHYKQKHGGHSHNHHHEKDRQLNSYTNKVRNRLRKWQFVIILQIVFHSSSIFMSINQKYYISLMQIYCILELMYILYALLIGNNAIQTKEYQDFKPMVKHLQRSQFGHFIGSLVIIVQFLTYFIYEPNFEGEKNTIIMQIIRFSCFFFFLIYLVIQYKLYVLQRDMSIVQKTLAEKLKEIQFEKKASQYIARTTAAQTADNSSAQLESPSSKRAELIAGRKSPRPDTSNPASPFNKYTESFSKKHKSHRHNSHHHGHHHGNQHSHHNNHNNFNHSPSPSKSYRKKKRLSN